MSDTTVRSVRVRLDADVAKYVADMRLAGRETDKAFAGVNAPMERLDKRLASMDHNLASISSSTRSAAADTRSFETRLNAADTAVTRFGRNTQRTGSQIDTLSGRLGIAAQAGAAFGPALLPIAAVGVPALAGLTTQLGFAGLAAGTTLLAVQGIGEALDVIERARVDPTVANVAAAQAEFEGLGRGAQQLVLHLEDLRDEGIRLRDIAGNNLLPGADDALSSLETRLPEVKRLIREVADATGDQLRNAGASLASDRYDDFFQFLQSEARPNIDALAESVGHLGHGFTEALEGLQPLERGFANFLSDGTGKLDTFLTEADYSGFIDYIQTNGPQVADTLGAISGALLAVVEATAPLGGPALQTIETLANLVATIADSPLGTPLAAIVAALSSLSLLNKGLAATRALTAGGLLGSGTSTAAAAGAAGATGGGLGSFFSDNADDIKEAVGRIRENISTIASTAATTGARTQRETARMSGAFRSLAANSGRLSLAVGKAAAPIAGLALVSSGASDAMGLTNTTSLALAGSMAGPVAGGIGAAVGLTLDFLSATDDAQASVESLDTSLRGSDFSTFTSRAADARTQLEGLTDSKIFGTDFLGSRVGKLVNTIAPVSNIDRFKGALDGTTDDLRSSVEASQAADDAFQQLAETVGGSLATVATQAQPAMQALGISIDDLAKASPVELDGLLAQIVGFQDSAATTEGRTLTLASSFDALDDSLLPLPDRAKAVQDALDNLLAPNLNLSQATDQYRAGLRNLNDELAENGRSLTRHTDAGDKNRAAIRSRVEDVKALVSAEAAGGASSGQLAASLLRGRDAILKAGEAAGLSKKEVRDYLNQLGLTPKSIATTVNVNTEAALRALAGIQAYTIRDKSFTVTQHTNATLGEAAAVNGLPGKKAKGSASGGTVPNPHTAGPPACLLEATP